MAAILFHTIALALFVCIAVCHGFSASSQTLHEIDDKDLDKISGMAMSRRHQGVAYVVNGEGDESEIYAIDLSDGDTVATLDIKHASSYDWEDLAIGPCIDDCWVQDCRSGITPSRYCLYIADTGDDSSEHNGQVANVIYMVREPDHLHKDIDLHPVGTLRFSWSEENAESLMVSPDGRVFIISEDGLMAELPYEAWNKTTKTALDKSQSVKLLDLTEDPVAADISPLGNDVLVLTKDEVLYYSIPEAHNYVGIMGSKRGEKVSGYTAMKHTHSVAWAPDGKSFFVTPAEEEQHIYKYARRDGGPQPVVSAVVG